MPVYDPQDIAGLGRASMRGYVVAADMSAPTPGSGVTYPRGGTLGPGSTVPIPAPSVPTTAYPSAYSGGGGNNNGAMPAQVAQLQALVTKLRGDVATLSNTIRTYNQAPGPGQKPTGLQLAFQALIKRVQVAEGAVKNGGASTQQVAALQAQNKKLQGDVATLTNTIRTYNQPTPPGQQPTGLQLAYRKLITQIQQLQARH